MRVSGPVMAHNYGRITQNAFGGLNKNIGAADGEIAEMVNMTGDYYPLLATREQGWVKSTPFPSIQDIAILAFEIIDGREVWAIKTAEDEEWLYILLPNGEQEAGRLLYHVGEEKKIVYVNGKICVFPEKVFYDTAIEKANTYIYEASIPADEKIEGNYVFIGDVGSASLHRYWQGEWVQVNHVQDMETRYYGQYTIEDGTIAGIEAEKNTVKIARANITGTFLPEIGDAISVNRSTNPRNVKTSVIKEIETDETYIYLRFSENAFSTSETVTGMVKRAVPDLKHVCEHKNRLWGCVDNQIYASHLGNPLNWYEYESLADGAWAVEIGSGELTACFSYNYPLFFTETEIYTVLGDAPMEFALSVTPNTYGCAKGSHKSFAVVREYLFYHSPYGFCYYYGSVPQLCSYNLGTMYYHDAIGGGKGHKYYVSCDDSENLPHNFVFDARLSTWHEERNDDRAAAYAWDGDLYAVYGGKLYTVGLPRTQYDEPEFEEDDMPSLVRFAPWDMDSVNKKQLKGICIRHDVEGELTVKLFQDGVENVSLRKTITGKGMTEIPNIPRRGDTWYLQLEGVGPWKVYSIAYDVYEGSARK